MLFIYRPKAIIQAECPIEWSYIINKACDFINAAKIEYHGAILLDKNYDVLEIVVDSKGNRTSVIPRKNELMERAAAIQASYLVDFHNHANGGNAIPSEKDELFYKKFKTTTSEFYVQLIDSIVLSSRCNAAFQGYSIEQHNIFYTNFMNNYIQSLEERNYEFVCIKSDFPSIKKTWGIYDRWEKETAKPYIFKSNAKRFPSIGQKKQIKAEKQL